MLGVTSAETLTAIYDAARYDDDRPSSPASRCPTPGRWPARSTPAAAVKRPSRWGCATAAGSCSSTASRGTRRRAATASTTNPDGHAAGVRAVTPSPGTPDGSASMAHTATWRRGKRATGLPSVSPMVAAVSPLAFNRRELHEVPARRRALLHRRDARHQPRHICEAGRLREWRPTIGIDG